MEPIEKKLEQALRWEVDAHAERSDRWEAIAAGAYQPKPTRERRFSVQKVSAVAVAAAMVLVAVGIARAGMMGKLPSGDPADSCLPGGTGTASGDSASLAYATPPPLEGGSMTGEFAEVLRYFTAENRGLSPESIGDYVTLTLTVYRGGEDMSVSASSLNWDESGTLEGAYAFPDLPPMPPFSSAETYGLTMTGELAEFYAQELNAGTLGDTPLYTFLTRLRGEEYPELRGGADGTHYWLSVFTPIGALYPFYDSEPVNNALPHADAAFERFKEHAVSSRFRDATAQSLLRQSLQASAEQDDIAYTMIRYGSESTSSTFSAMQNGGDTAFGIIGNRSSGAGLALGTIHEGLEPTDDVLLMGWWNAQELDGPCYGFVLSNRLLRQFLAEKDTGDLSSLVAFIERVGKGEVPLEEGDLIAFLDDASWTAANQTGVQVGNVYRYAEYPGDPLRPDTDAPAVVFERALTAYRSVAGYRGAGTDDRYRITEEDGQTYYRVADTDTMERKAAKLRRYFSTEIVNELLHENPLYTVDENGVLYAAQADYPGNQYLEGVHYDIVELTDSRCEYEIRVRYGEGWEGENPEVTTAVCEKVDGNWVFTVFPYFY